MASVILKSVGSVVGNIFMPGFGGALLGGLGAGLGGLIDNQLGLGTTVTGPRLENLSVQDSRYGAGIPIVYGNARIAGNVIWSTKLLETQHTDTSGGKGGGVTTKTYTYSVHCAVGICAGPIAGINTIWADSVVIYQNGVWTSGLFDGVTIYKGDDAQTPDSFMQSILGMGDVPSYRGLAYIVFDNLQLDSFGNRMPNLTFEIAAAAATKDPVCLGTVNPAISACASAANGSMLPIVLQNNGADVQKVLIGGFVPNGATSTFLASAYDVMGNAPVLLETVSSESFSTAGTRLDSAWALSPDKRFVVFYIQNTVAPSHSFAIYDSETKTFGPVFSSALSASSSSTKQPAWIDAQHFVIDDISGGVRGLHVFARAGMSIIDLGFTGLWGSGSASNSKPFYGAQFTPYADGLLAYNLVTSSSTLRARTIAWRNNQLSLGTTYTVAANLPLGSGSGPHALFLKTGSNEWTLLYGTVMYFCLMSFEPSDSSAVLTRPWQMFEQDFGIGSTNFPLFYGDRLLIVQNGIDGNFYLLSEVSLNAGSFTLSVDAAEVTGLSGIYDVFYALKLDSSRLLFLGVGGSPYAVRQAAIFERNALGSLAAILSDILTRAGYAVNDFDVSALADSLIQGYILQEPMSARHAIEPLQTYAPFDLIETSGQLKAVRRGGNAAVSVPASEWRAAMEDKNQPAPLLVTRAQEMDLPREVNIDVVDPSRNFEVNCQRARRLASSARMSQKISLPVVCTADTAKKIAETKLYTAWAERDLVKVSVSRAYFALDPSDIIDLGNGDKLRIASVMQSGGLITLEGFYSQPSSLSSDALADGGQGIAANGNDPVSSVLYLMDLPLLQSADDQPGVYVSATGLSGWKGAALLRSGDGSSYASVVSLSKASTAGIAATVLGFGSALYIDKNNSVNVQVTQGTLSSCSEIDLLNGANAALLGDEIIQFQTATLAGPGLYTLSNLLRGRRGTENATSAHIVGERFVLLQSGTTVFLPDVLSDRNKAFNFRALSTGQNLSEAHDYAFTYGLKTLCPFAPVNIKGARAAGISGDLTCTWTRRARLNAEWVDYIDVPLDEPQELYEADIMNGSTILRAFTGLTTPTVTYTVAQQTADWGGSIPSTFTVNIYQVSARYGNGNAATALI
ncbi:MAG: phage tail protein [Bdellovibrionales bacterium]